MVSKQAAAPSCCNRQERGNALSDKDKLAERAARYRGVAETLRRLADQIRYDFNRQNQLLTLADAFLRAAERIEARSR